MLLYIVCVSVCVMGIQAMSPDLELQKRSCSNAECRMYCEHGFERDKNGCTVCKCREAGPPVVKPGNCPHSDSPLMCNLMLYLEDCTGDEWCPGEEKCCNDGCRTKCKVPV